ncbi:MAG: redoxin domain-containing protein, partial [Planctomycetaceae bacterium]
MRRTLTTAAMITMTAVGSMFLPLGNGPSIGRAPLLSVAGPLPHAAVAERSAPSQNSITTPLRLTDLNGQVHNVPYQTDRLASVYVFLGLQCPISNRYIPELNRQAATFEPLGIAFYGIVSDPHTTPEEARDHQRQYPLDFPVLYDPTGSGRLQLRATHTPQVVIVEQSGRIAYSGRIDDRYADIGRQRPHITRHDMRDALTAIASGTTVARRSTTPVGCLLEPFPSESKHQQVTFTRDIAPIVYANCTECHRPGESAPFPLQSYRDVVRHAQQIREVVQNKLMPPWKPETGFGHFKNARQLAGRDSALLLNWIAAGAPHGDVRDTPPPPVFTTGWQLGKPDLILELDKPFPVPADGPDIYRHFVLPSGLLENRLVSAMEFRPGDPRVVHHALAYLDRSGTARQLDAADPGQGYSRFGGPGFTPSGNLGGWGPGGLPRRLPAGMGRVIWQDCDVVLQIHYHPIGQSTQDRSRIGLYFADPDAQTLVSEILVANVDLDIPAGAQRHSHHATYTLPVDTCLLDTTP